MAESIVKEGVECRSELYILFVLHHTTHLRVIGTHGAARVKVDTIIDEWDHIMSNMISDAGGERTAFASGEGTIDIFSVGDFAGIIEEAVHVDDGHTDHRTACNTIDAGVEYAAYDLHAVDLVAVHAGHECEGGAPSSFAR